MDSEEEKIKTIPHSKVSNNGNIIGIIVVVVIITVVGYTYERQTKQEGKTSISASHSTASTGAKSIYKDGTYTVEGDYITHIGPKQIKVTITLKHDIVTNADVANQANDPVSFGFQEAFISGYKSMVVGKDISTIHLGKISLSSLTPNGFNSALQTIEKEAKS